MQIYCLQISISVAWTGLDSEGSRGKKTGKKVENWDLGVNS